MQQWLPDQEEWSQSVLIINATASAETAEADSLQPDTFYRFTLQSENGVLSNSSNGLVIHTLQESEFEDTASEECLNIVS